MEKKIMGRPKGETKSIFTLYLGEETLKNFNSLYAVGIMTGSKETKSGVICRAINQLHKREFNKVEKGQDGK